jgi:V/A-type H+-transporting ATPase subunit A
MPADLILFLTGSPSVDVRILNIPVTMVQKWPVKIPIKSYKEKPRPFKLLETGVRTIDTLNPIVEGGTGFIPGPFGSGKTVLQHAISKQAEADIVVMAACGERANGWLKSSLSSPNWRIHAPAVSSWNEPSS